MEDGKMAADTNLLQGQVVENPGAQKLDVEAFLAAFLQSLLKEQRESPESGPSNIAKVIS
jgi:hypothetical protein